MTSPSPDREIWDRLFASVPPAWREAPPSRAMLACERWLAAVKARTVLDVGCGIGRWAVWLQARGFDVAGADLSPNGVQYARQWAEDLGLTIPFTCAPVTESAFPHRRFDAVVAALILDLVSPGEFGVALERIREALVPNGVLFTLFNPTTADEPDPDNPTAGITRVLYTDEEIIGHLERAGFSLVNREECELSTRGFLWSSVSARTGTTRPDPPS